MPAAYQLTIARSKGYCTTCCCRPARPNRKSCELCGLKSSIHSLFRLRRNEAQRKAGNCFVDGYDKSWIKQVLNTFNGRCHYTNRSIEIYGNQTAAVVLDIPRLLVSEYGETTIHHPSNVRWCHRDVVDYKRNMTADDFKELWDFMNDAA